MKTFKKLSKAEMKNVKGGGAQSCIVTGGACMVNAQCCSGVCALIGGHTICTAP